MQKISTHLKEMMKNADVTVPEAAECIGCSVGTFRNKLSKDRFSVNELMILCEICNYHLAFIPNSLELDTSSCNDSTSPYLFDVDSYIPDEESKVKVKIYRNGKFDKVFDILKSYVNTLNPSEAEKFSQLRLPLNFDGRHLQISVELRNDDEPDPKNPKK